MTGSTAVDIALGVIFIFLLYSLLSSVIAEIIATLLRLRARNLASGIARLLEEDEKKLSTDRSLNARRKNQWDKILKFLAPKKYRHATNKFYEHPSIKYLAKKHSASTPSYIPTKAFSKAVIDILKDGQTGSELQKIRQGIEASLKIDSNLIDLKIELESPEPNWDSIKGHFEKIKNLLSAKSNDKTDAAKQLQTKNLLELIETQLSSEAPDARKIKRALSKIHIVPFLSGETAKLVSSFLDDAKGDIDKFKLIMEEWFDSTMERVSGWYKRKNHYILMAIGLVLAIAFNVNTIEIVKKLAIDETARGQIVDLATSYTESNPEIVAGLDKVTDSSFVSDTLQPQISELNNKLDSLLEVKTKLNEDIDKANSIMGFQLPDSLVASMIGPNSKFTKDSLKPNQRIIEFRKTKYLVNFPSAFMADEGHGYYYFDKCGGISKVKTAHFNYIKHRFENFLGYLITALAISLGATFWFDLLNKFVKLRTAIQPQKQSASGGKDSTNINAVG